MIKNLDERTFSQTHCIVAAGSYVTFTPMNKVFVARLRHFSELLEPEGWIRCHRSYLINPKFIDFDKTAPHEITLLSGRKYPVARRSIGTINKIIKELKFLKNPKDEININSNYPISV